MFAIVAIVLALQTVSPEGARHMQAGLNAHKQGRFDVAIAEFRKATETDPTLAQAFLNLGEEYINIQDYASSIAPLKRALALDPSLEAAHQQLGYSMLTQGFAAEAIPHLEGVHAIEALGIAQVETGQYQAAIMNLSAALEKRPNDPDLLYYLGRAAGLLSKSAIDTMMTEHPDSARSHQAMAENYLVLRQMPQAETELRQALKQRPDMPGLHLELGFVYAGSANWAQAEQEFRAETRLRPGNAEASYRLGSALLQEGKIHEARLELERSNHLKPDMPETLYLVGKAASLDGDTALAEKTWHRLIEIEDKSSLAAQAHFGLAALYRKQHDLARAESEMQQFRTLNKAVSAEGPK
jgi:tetratricopeptide (TPR) repeat protein